MVTNPNGKSGQQQNLVPIKGFPQSKKIGRADKADRDWDRFPTLRTAAEYARHSKVRQRSSALKIVATVFAT